MRQNDIAQLNESTLSAIGMDKATIAAFRQITKQVSMVAGAISLPEVAAAQGQSQETIDAFEPLLRALIASHTDSLRAQLGNAEHAPDTAYNDGALRRRLDDLEAQLADMRPAPLAPAALALAATSCFAVYQSGAQSYNAATFNQVQFQTSQFDDLSEFSTTTNAFTVRAAGTYVFTTGVTGNQSELTNRSVSLYLNGVERVRLGQNLLTYGNVPIQGHTPPLRLAAGDVVTVYYFTGLADTGTTGPVFTYFGGARIK